MFIIENAMAFKLLLSMPTKHHLKMSSCTMIVETVIVSSVYVNEVSKEACVHHATRHDSLQTRQVKYSHYISKVIAISQIKWTKNIKLQNFYSTMTLMCFLFGHYNS